MAAALAHRRLDTKQRKVLNLCMVVVWLLWRNRNRCFHEARCMISRSLGEAAKKIVELNEVGRASVEEAVALTATFNQQTRWLPPPPDLKKLNVDAAFCAANGEATVSMVLRDSNGVVVHCGIRKLDNVPSALHAEILALIFGLEEAKDIGCDSLITEPDCAVAVHEINDLSVSLHEWAKILKKGEQIGAVGEKRKRPDLQVRKVSPYFRTGGDEGITSKRKVKKKKTRDLQVRVSPYFPTSGDCILSQRESIISEHNKTEKKRKLSSYFDTGGDCVLTECVDIFSNDGKEEESRDRQVQNGKVSPYFEIGGDCVLARYDNIISNDGKKKWQFQNPKVSPYFQKSRDCVLTRYDKEEKPQVLIGKVSPYFQKSGDCILFEGENKKPRDKKVGNPKVKQDTLGGSVVKVSRYFGKKKDNENCRGGSVVKVSPYQKKNDNENCRDGSVVKVSPYLQKKDNENCRGGSVINVSPYFQQKKDNENCSGGSVVKVSQDNENCRGGSVVKVSPYFKKKDNENCSGGSMVKVSPYFQKKDNENCRGGSVVKVSPYFQKKDNESCSGGSVVKVSPYFQKKDNVNCSGGSVVKVSPHFQKTKKTKNQNFFSNGLQKPVGVKTTLSADQKKDVAYLRKAPDNTWKPPRSNDPLIQEDYAHDPWMVLVIYAKTATEVSTEEIVKIIQPLGFQNKRAQMIQRMSKEYLFKEWTYVTELHGIGK
ncbi:hypothetical protein COLO4_05916 [Corchorus olitorius]|uniref:RNase H type-1 domain-containing protein n=1 Tax=Corchorus olitorius TaxID=93759 RepID=A0A1R3KPH0_9ROSI|nr:hypothetical protein COLO4_05916 [Corchorus olitorius]